MKRILIVDDEEVIRSLLKVTFEDQGYNINTLEASNAHDALHIIKEALRSNCRINLVILDIRMPGMTGVELLPIIKGLDADIRVILHTAYKQYQESFESFAADAYIIKSADLCELVYKVEELLRY